MYEHSIYNLYVYIYIHVLLLFAVFEVLYNFSKCSK